MDKIRNMHNVALGIIIGLFLGGIFQARPKFEWNLGVKQPVIPQWNINKIKSAIIKEKSIKDYELLKELSGGHLKKEDIFYGLLMNEYHPNDTIYKDLRNVLVEIYNIPPKDTITLMRVKKLDEMYKNNK